MIMKKIEHHVTFIKVEKVEEEISTNNKVAKGQQNPNYLSSICF